MATLIIKNPDGSEQEQELASSLSVGRSEGNDLILSEGGVSRKHARFFLEGSAVMVEDVGSANGTWVDGEKIEGPTSLTAKSQVVIGDYEVALKNSPSRAAGPKPKTAARPSREPTAPRGSALKPGAGGPRSTRVMEAVNVGKPSAGAALAKRQGPQRASGPQLRGLSGSVTGKTFPLSGTVVVGRVAGVDLQVDDDSVSRKHAELTVSGREVSVKDLGSANGTTVNGAPIAEETLLSPGDILQFGVVELMFETGTPSGSRAPISRSPARAPSRPERPSPRAPAPADSFVDDPDAAPPMDPATKKKLIIGVSIASAVLLLLFVRAVTADPPPVDNKPVPLTTGKRPKNTVVERTPEEQMEDLLAECRTYSNSERGAPDWARAQAACNKVLELEPIHDEANSLLKRISVLKVCEENLNRGRELASTGNMEEAVRSFGKVGRDCEGYLLKTLSASKEAVAEVKALYAADCKRYSSNAKWEFALKSCEEWTKLWCQNIDPKELYPPALFKLNLDGRLNLKTDWRPTEPLYVNFLKARQKLLPNEPMWLCPEIPAFRPPPPPPDRAKEVKAELAKRFADPELGRALALYYDGKFPEAPIPLQKIIENVNKAQYHEQAKTLLRDINMATNLYENGTTEITNEHPERAEAPFLKSLTIDERLVLGDKAASMSADEKKRELEKRASFIRRTIVDTMSRTAYDRGRALQERKDYRAACKMWKLGATFSRSNIDLLKSLTNVCTKRADEAYNNANSCAQFQAALDFAVDGDGFKEKITAEMENQGCN